MQIDRIYYPVKTLGYGNRIGIWTVGCTHQCKKCSNPELWERNPLKDISVENIISCVQQIKDADGITITGGEPFQQAEELRTLVTRLNEIGYEDILVYSGYTLDELKLQGDKVKQILDNISVLVDGRYIDELNDNKSFRGSSNQKIYRLNDSIIDRYANAEEWERVSQIVMNDDKIQLIGVPIKK